MNKYHGNPQKPVSLYVLKNPRSDVYIGITNDLERRVRQHKENKRDAYRKLGCIMRLHCSWGPFTNEEAPKWEIALQRYESAKGGLAVLMLATLTKEQLVSFLAEQSK